MNSKVQLYLNLAKDATNTAEREKKYAKIALSEKKYSLKDKKIACHKKQPARKSDDEYELSIDKEFYKYRMGVSKHYEKIAKMYKMLALRERRKAHK